MSSIAGKSTSKETITRKPYVAPSAQRISPEEARQLLLRGSDVNDPEVQHLLKRIDELRMKKTS